MRQGRWTTSAAMRGYIREGELFVNNPSAKLGCRRLLMARSPIDDSMRQAKGQSDGAAVAVA
jgi:hypothetical protein